MCLQRGHICCSYNHTCHYDNNQRLIEQLDHLAAASGRNKGKRGRSSPSSPRSSSSRLPLLDMLLSKHDTINLDDDDDNIPTQNDDHRTDRPHRTRTRNNGGSGGGGSNRRRTRTERHRLDVAAKMLGSRKERKKYSRQVARRRRKNLKSLELLTRYDMLAALPGVVDNEQQQQQQQQHRHSLQGDSAHRTLSSTTPHEEVDTSGYGFLYDDSDMGGGEEGGGDT